MTCRSYFCSSADIPRDNIPANRIRPGNACGYIKLKKIPCGLVGIIPRYKAGSYRFCARSLKEEKNPGIDPAVKRIEMRDPVRRTHFLPEGFNEIP